jgi:hypothetical protein
MQIQPYNLNDHWAIEEIQGNLKNTQSEMKMKTHFSDPMGNSRGGHEREVAR